MTECTKKGARLPEIVDAQEDRDIFMRRVCIFLCMTLLFIVTSKDENVYRNIFLLKYLIEGQ